MIQANPINGLKWFYKINSGQMRIPHYPKSYSTSISPGFFEAAQETLWKMLNQPSPIALWFGLKDVDSPEVTLDVGPGGKFRHCMQVGEERFWHGGIYRTVEPPTCLVSTANLDFILEDNEILVTLLFFEENGECRISWM